MSALLEIKDIAKSFKLKGHWLHKKTFNALSPLSFTIEAKKTLAIVGEAGSGKSTLAKVLVGAESPSSGEIFLNGQLLQDKRFKQRCQHIRMIFQDSGTTLNPSLTIKNCWMNL